MVTGLLTSRVISRYMAVVAVVFASFARYPKAMTELDPDTFTLLLRDSRQGRSSAHERIFSQLYEELRGMARREFHRGAASQTLQPTVLVHEAYMRLARTESLELQDRSHFFALAANVMRRVLIDHYRQKKAQKRGGELQRVPLTAADGEGESPALDLLALDEALERLNKLDERKCRVVELRYFAGMKLEEVAEALGVSLRTVEADWYFARSWLRKELG